MDHTFHYFQFLFAYPTLTFVVVQSLSRVQFFVMPWTAACQASLSFTISWSLLQFMSTQPLLPSSFDPWELLNPRLSSLCKIERISTHMEFQDLVCKNTTYLAESWPVWECLSVGWVIIILTFKAGIR